MSKPGIDRGARLSKGDLKTIHRELEETLARGGTPYTFTYRWNGSQKVELRAEIAADGKVRHSIMDVDDAGKPVEDPKKSRRWLRF